MILLAVIAPFGELIYILYVCIYVIVFDVNPFVVEISKAQGQSGLF